jgi:hypothetical protein
MWLCIHGMAICKEFSIRFGQEHPIQDLIVWGANYIPDIPDIEETPAPQIMPEIYQHQDPVVAYRNYYIWDKRAFATWGVVTPVWWYLDKFSYFSDRFVKRDEAVLLLEKYCTVTVQISKDLPQDNTS